MENLNIKDTIKFIREKNYTFKENLQHGGTGKTILVHDDIINLNFVIKKYKPNECNKLYEKEFFLRFINEIKLLFLMTHKNIVRIYNYHLYSDKNTGYIVMEHIDGLDLETYLVFSKTDEINNIFLQLIEGFNYLEKNNILHRDIKSNNILITNDGIVKIIDFGFGKSIDNNNSDEVSIYLNTWNTDIKPSELKTSTPFYDVKTEIFFVGLMFNHLINKFNIHLFKHSDILEKMIESNYESRISSFEEILRLISTKDYNINTFQDHDINIYRIFSNAIYNSLICIYNDYLFEDDNEVIFSNLESFIKNNFLEESILNPSDLINCFIKSNYELDSNMKNRKIKFEIVKNFFHLLQESNKSKKDFLLNNLKSKLKQIHLDLPLPF